MSGGTEARRGEEERREEERNLQFEHPRIFRAQVELLVEVYVAVRPPFGKCRVVPHLVARDDGELREHGALPDRGAHGQAHTGEDSAAGPTAGQHARDGGAHAGDGGAHAAAAHATAAHTAAAAAAAAASATATIGHVNGGRRAGCRLEQRTQRGMRRSPPLDVRLLILCDSRLRLEQRSIVLRRAADRLARIVDDQVEAAHELWQRIAQRLKPLEVTKVRAHHVQAVLPSVRILLRLVPPHGINGEARRGDDLASASQQLEHDAEADLDAPACHEGYAPIEAARAAIRTLGDRETAVLSRAAANQQRPISSSLAGLRPSRCTHLHDSVRFVQLSAEQGLQSCA